MRTKWMSFVMGCLVVAACEAQPASSGPDGLEATLAQGLTILESEPGLHTRAAYRAGERAVFIETRRAEKTPDEYLAADPSLPVHGVDVRITDAAGALVYARIAGDGADFADDDVPVPAPELRAADIALARAGLAALGAGRARSLVGEAEADEAKVLEEVSASLTIDAADDVADVDPAAIASAELDGTASAAATSYKHRIELWKAHCCVPGGWHSATRMDSSSDGSHWTSRVDWCNHGRCPQGEGMSEPCSYTSGWRSGKARAQKCSTGYNVTSLARAHNCNDDSHLEVIDVRHNRLYSTDDGSCHDFGANPDPDGCDPSTW